MSNLTKGLVLVIVIVAIGLGLVIWKKKVGGNSAESFNSISREEVEMLLADVAKTNPAVLKRFTEDPEMKKQQLENLKELLAFASEAQATGLAKEGTNKQELENIKAEITAVNYDRDMNKDKGPMPPFGFITEDQVNAYWGQDSQPAPAGGFWEKIGLGTPAETRSHEVEFQNFLDTKIALLKAGNPEMKDREISEDERKQARDIFAKIRIYYNEYSQKLAAGQIPKELADRVALQVKLQEAQFLARIYSESIADKIKVTDEDIDKYIAEHKELDPAEKKNQAMATLKRAQGGEDFAALANEFTSDPGNKGPTGEPQGGLYKDVTKGKMMPAFEQGALALEEGQVGPELIETDYGFHIIKLERKLGKKEGTPGETYDVRHILISTGYKDADKPMAREMPVKEYVRAKLQEEKEKKLLEEIVAKNNVSVPSDFTVPEVSAEQMQQMQQKQMQQQMQQMQPPPGADMDAEEGQPGAKPAKPEAKKPEPKKK